MSWLVSRAAVRETDALGRTLGHGPLLWAPSITVRMHVQPSEQPGLPARTIVELHGDLDENADFGDLRDRLRGDIAIDLSGIRRIRSAGIREWLGFIRDLPHVTSMVLIGCSVPCVIQLNIVHNFRGPARVASFRAPYVCASCGDFEVLVERDEVSWHRETLAYLPVDCPRCGELMEFDEVPDRYFQFLADA